MDPNEKRLLRSKIGEHLDVSRTRMADYEAQQLSDFIDSYADYRGKSTTRTRSFTGPSSDGKYTRKEKFTDTFMEDQVGIRQEYEYRDDDGQTGSRSTDLTDARGILNWFRSQH